MSNISITYGGFTVGGSSGTYLLNGPYVIDRSFSTLRIVAEVIVSVNSVTSLQASADALETAFTRRDQNFTIAMPGGDTWSYTFGETALNTTASCAKTGSPETNLGAARAYTITIEAQMPAIDRSGLQNLEVAVQFAPSRQRTVAMRGAYTAFEGATAVEQYTNEFDTEATTVLQEIDNDATWELVAEEYSRDRNTHMCNFTRQYVELLADQSANGRDDPAIEDHRVVFTDLSQHPGDALPGIYRLRRVTGSYACSVNITESQDLRQVYRESVRGHMMEVFANEFDPIVYAIEDERVSYDETQSRIDVSLQIVYQKGEGGSQVVEMAQSVAIHEMRTIDYTPVHEQGEFSAFADVGWSVRERHWNRTVIVVGTETPKSRIGNEAAAGEAGLWVESVNGQSGVDQRNKGTVEQEGWNIVSNTSQTATQWLGSPRSEGGFQFPVTTLTETVVERYHVKPRVTQIPPSTGGPGN